MYLGKQAAVLHVKRRVLDVVPGSVSLGSRNTLSLVGAKSLLELILTFAD